MNSYNPAVCHEASRQRVRSSPLLFFFNDTATTEIYTLSLHDALPISVVQALSVNTDCLVVSLVAPNLTSRNPILVQRDRKSTRLNSSHVRISYAVFCLKKNKEVQALEALARCDTTPAGPTDDTRRYGT